VFWPGVAVTFHDPDHSISEQRFITVGMSSAGRVLDRRPYRPKRRHQDHQPVRRRSASENIRKKRVERRDTPDALRREHDLSKLQGGIRGKCVARYKRGTNLPPQDWCIGNHTAPYREIGPCSFAAGLLAGKMAVIVVPKALESTVNSP
jgi:hypothetical protein